MYDDFTIDVFDIEIQELTLMGIKPVLTLPNGMRVVGLTAQETADSYPVHDKRSAQTWIDAVRGNGAKWVSTPDKYYLEKRRRGLL